MLAVNSELAFEELSVSQAGKMKRLVEDVKRWLEEPGPKEYMQDKQSEFDFEARYQMLCKFVSDHLDSHLRRGLQVEGSESVNQMSQAVNAFRSLADNWTRSKVGKLRSAWTVPWANV